MKKIQPLHGPIRKDVGHWFWGKMYQMRDVYSRGITYMIICNAMCSI